MTVPPSMVHAFVGHLSRAGKSWRLDAGEAHEAGQHFLGLWQLHALHKQDHEQVQASSHQSFLLHLRQFAS